MGVDAFDRMTTSIISKSTVGGKNFTGFRSTMAPLKAALVNKAPMTELVEVYWALRPKIDTRDSGSK